MFKCSTFCIDRKPSEKDLAGIAQAIGHGWELLGPALGVNTSTVEQIKMDHRFSTIEQIYYMFVEWKRNAGRKATFANLFKELQNTSAMVNWDHIEQKMGFESR